MSDVIRVAHGQTPWQPYGSEVIEVFNFYDQPLMGIIRQDGCLYLFDCLYGHVEGLSLWLYSLIQESDAQELANASADEFDHIRGRLHASERGVMAIAIDDVGIVANGLVENVPESISEVVGILVDEYLEIVRRMGIHQREARELEDSDKSQLVPAGS